MSKTAKKVVAKTSKKKKRLQAKKKGLQKLKKAQITHGNEESDADVLLKSYINCLNIERFDDSDFSYVLGSIIFNENGSFKLFGEFTKLDCKEQNKLWNKYAENKKNKISTDHTINTLIEYAKEDNAAKAEAAHGANIHLFACKIIKEGINDKNAAALFYYCNQKNIIYDELNNQWYILNEYNRWEKESTYEITKRISDLLPPHIQRSLLFLVESRTLDNLDSAQKDAVLEDWKKNALRAKKYVCMVRSCKNISEKLIEFYKNKSVFEKMDNVNHYIFAFNNKVYDLEHKKRRLAKPEEYISMTCGYNYEEIDQVILEDINKILNSIFENEEDKVYVLTTIAQCLSGMPSNEKFYLWRGLGRNGKGVLRDLIMACFGPYFDAMEIEYLIKPKFHTNATAADGFMIRKKNCRIIVTTEPEPDGTAELKANKICQWSGGDPIQCRPLYGEPIEFKAKFKLFIQSNFDVSFGGSTSTIKAMLARLEVLEFPLCFVDKPVMDHERPLDSTIKERIAKNSNKYGMAFFSILLPYYKNFINNGGKITLPKSVIKQTKLYFVGNDPFTPFYNEVIEKVNNKKENTKARDLFATFKKYHGNSNDIKMNATQFKAAMQNKGHKLSLLNGYDVWRGIKINHNKLINNNNGGNEYVEV